MNKKAIPIILLLSLLIITVSVFGTIHMAKADGGGTSTYTVSGYVLAPDGSGVANAYVVLYSADGSSIEIVSTDSSGHYVIAGVLDGSYTLYVYPPSGSGLGYAQESVTVSGDTIVPTITLQVGYTVSGHVLLSDGSGCSNFWVNMYGLSGGLVGAVYSDSSGYYSISGVPAGTYTMNVYSNNGFLAYTDSVTVSGSMTIDITLETVSGYVLAPDGSGVNNAQVDLYNAADGSGAGDVSTDSSGHYVIAGVPVGSYTLYVFPSSGSNLVSAQESVTVSGDTTLNITLQVGYTASGYVLAPDGSGVANAYVALYNAADGNGAGDGYTDSSGHYVIAGVPDGSYTLYVFPSSGSNLVSAQESVTVSGDTIVPTITLQVGYTVSGYVLAPDGSGVNNAQVDLYNAADGSLAGGGYTDSSGHYVIAGVPVGSYTLYVFPSSGSNLVSAQESVTVSGDTTLNINLQSNVLVAPSISASANTINLGQSSTLSSIVNSGASPYTYQWFAEAPGASSYISIDGANSDSYNFATLSSTAPGSWGFILQVTDNNGVAVNSTAVSVTVLSSPFALPEYTLGPIGALGACFIVFIAYAVFKTKLSNLHFNKHLKAAFH